MKKCACAFLLVLVIVIPTSVIHASLVTPPGLSPGDQFHWAFITNADDKGNSDDIADYNYFVNREAGSNHALTEGLGIDWRAVASTSTVNAKDNVNVTAPVYRLDGVKIADDAADLWNGSLLCDLDINQFGNEKHHSVWTGTLTNGFKDEVYPLGSVTPRRGLQPGSGAAWITNDTYDNNWGFPMYAISEVQTVQTVVPVPAAVWILGSGLLGLVGIRRGLHK
jgi:hypothetical protein